MEDYKTKYEKAIEQAKKELQTCGSLDCDAARQIFRFFPELKKSEDERIKKEIIQFLQLSHPQFVGKRNQEKWIAWLEKQGEKKLAAKVEPKFKIGDKVHLINGSSPNYEDDCIVISDISNNTYYGNWEGGYFAIKDQDKYELVEQKPAWSEEDKKMWATVTDLLWEGYKLSDKKVSWYNIRYWLLPKIICLKERVQAQLKQEWTGYDEKAYEIALLDIDKSPSITKNDSINWLKSLKERYNWKPSDEQMKVLYKYAEQNNHDGSVLTSLYRDLKKLKGE